MPRKKTPLWMRAQGLIDLGRMLVEENRIADAQPVLLDCCKWHEDGLADGGAACFLTVLCRCCRRDQMRQIDYLIDEFCPPEPPERRAQIMRERARMHMKNVDHEGFYMTMNIVKRLQDTGLLPAEFSLETKP